MNIGHSDAVRILTSLAVSGGEAILSRYESADHAMSKPDSSPVTEADLAADAVIRAGLAAEFPDIPAVTEESAESHALSGARRFFLVDPLDGTKEFVQRRGDFTVNIALIEDGAPVFGVVYAPARDRLFVGVVGEGAWEETPSTGAKRAIRARDADNEALCVVATKSHPNPETDAYIARYRIADLKNAGSSLKFCLVAAGEADLYPRLGPTMEWDTAAGHAVLAAAGGAVLRFPGDAPLSYGKPDWRNPHFIAHGPGLALA